MSAPSSSTFSSRHRQLVQVLGAIWGFDDVAAARVVTQRAGRSLHRWVRLCADELFAIRMDTAPEAGPLLEIPWPTHPASVFLADLDNTRVWAVHSTTRQLRDDCLVDTSPGGGTHQPAARRSRS